LRMIGNHGAVSGLILHSGALYLFPAGGPLRGCTFSLIVSRPLYRKGAANFPIIGDIFKGFLTPIFKHHPDSIRTPDGTHRADRLHWYYIYNYATGALSREPPTRRQNTLLSILLLFAANSPN